MYIENRNLIDAKLYFRNGKIGEAISKVNLAVDDSREAQLIKWANLFFLFNSKGDFDSASKYYSKIQAKDPSIFERIKGKSVLNMRETNGITFTSEEMEALQH